MKRLLILLVAMVLAVTVPMGLPVVTQGSATADITVFDQDRPGWESAVGVYEEEFFTDTTLNPGVSVVSEYPGYVDTAKGVWWDRLVCPADGQTTTTWQFSTPIVGFGGNWDPGVPGGPGAQIAVSIDGSWVNIGEIPSIYTGQFWGFVSSEPFDSVCLSPGSDCNGAWCETYEMDNMVYSLAQGVQITLPSEGDTFWIEALPEPTMPEIDDFVAKAELVGTAPTPPLTITEFTWDATIKYEEFGRNDSQSFGPTLMLGETWTSWTPDFRNIIMGGEMEIKVSVNIGGTIYEDTITVHIRGENPNEVTVKNLLGQTIYQAISYKETWPGHHWLQFHPQIDPNTGLDDPRYGLPQEQRGITSPYINVGWGLMQITYKANYQHIWDWTKNVKEGKERYHWAEKNWAASLVKEAKKDYSGNKDEQKIIQKTKLTKEQLMKVALYAYNAGTDEYYYVWDPINDVWVVNNELIEAGKQYVNDVLEYYNQVEACIKALEDGEEPPPLPSDNGDWGKLVKDGVVLLGE